MKTKYLYIGVGAICLAALSNTLMAALSKIEVEKGIATSMLLLWRSICALFVLIPILKFSPPKISFIKKIKTKKIVLLLIRALTGFIGVLFYFYCLRTLSLTVATLLYFTVPLFMPFVGYIWKKSPLPRWEWVGIIIGFIGVIFVVKPGHELFQWVSLLGLSAGLSVAISQFAAHLLVSTEPTKRINFYFFTVIGLIALPITFFVPSGSWTALHTVDYFYLIGVGIFGLGYTWLTTIALKHGSPTLISSFLYTVIVYSMILDWLVWMIVADWQTITGAILIICGVVLKFYLHKKETARHRK